MTPSGRPHSVCYLLAYREPDYIRTRTIVSALQTVPGLRTLRVINRSRGWWRYCELLWGLMMIRMRQDPETYILGFRGHEMFWPVRWLTWGRVLIFDAMMSPYGAIRDEGKLGKWGYLLAGVVKLLERGILKHADQIWTDTRRHRRWMMETFAIPGERIVVVPVGAVEGLPIREQPMKEAPFNVLFYGTFLPLHGVETIFKAAWLLRDQQVRFTIIGGRPDLAQWIRQEVKRCEGCVDYRERVPFADLINCYIPGSDLCLGGPFGDTPQAARVVTGKTQQCLALGKPVVLAHPDPEDGFRDRYNCLVVPPANPDALAAAIAWARDHPAELLAISRRGLSLYEHHFSINVVRRMIETHV
ncbi:MAG: glycosyltransferase [Magnetococcales bacterium]|nr:glycosyltransferase [Magnetococcales bacterium]